jgi:hypothetical protein
MKRYGSTNVGSQYHSATAMHQVGLARIGAGKDCRQRSGPGQAGRVPTTAVVRVPVPLRTWRGDKNEYVQNHVCWDAPPLTRAVTRERRSPQ